MVGPEAVQVVDSSRRSDIFPVVVPHDANPAIRATTATTNTTRTLNSQSAKGGSCRAPIRRYDCLDMATTSDRPLQTSNPWIDFALETPPFVIPADATHIDAFNKTLSPSDAPCCIDLSIPPEPWMGLHSSIVVLLLCNPGMEPQDYEVSRRPEVASALKANLTVPGGAPMLWLADEVADTPGGRWWRRTTWGMLEQGLDYSDIARRLLVVQFHAYHSVKWSCPPFTLPSQHAGFALVESAIDRGATIVLSRGAKPWKVAVPRLLEYPCLLSTRSVRNASLSARNIGDEGFQMIAQALSQCPRLQ